MHAGFRASDARYFKSTGLTNAVQYDARVRLIATGGTVTPGSSSISVANANDVVLLLLSVASNVKSYNDLTADYVTICSNNVANAAALGYPALRQAQTNDYAESVQPRGAGPGRQFPNQSGHRLPEKTDRPWTAMIPSWWRWIFNWDVT